MKHEQMPAIRRYALKINDTGDTVETINLGNVSSQQKNEILTAVFTQAMNRIGYIANE